MDDLVPGERPVEGLPVVLGSGVVFANSPAQSVEVAVERRQGAVSVAQAWQQITAQPLNTQQSIPTTSTLCQAIITNEQIVTSQNSLTERVHSFKVGATQTQREELQRYEGDFERIVEEIKLRQHRKEEKKNNRPVWRKKVGSGLEAFRETAVHYQKILDVINSQAPEYTTPVWGALKLILLISTNQADLRRGVEQHLTTIAHHFKIMRVLTDLSPTQETIDAVTEVYGGFLSFLEEALKYYSEGRWKRAAKAFGTPWEIRFKGFVEKIEHGVATVNQVTATNHMVESKLAYQAIDEVRLGQSRIERRASIIVHEIGRGFQELCVGRDLGNENIARSIRELIERLGPAFPALMDNKGLPASEAFQGLLESSQPRQLFEKEVESLSSFTLSNKVKEFRDETFPMLSQTDRDFESFFIFLKPRPSNHHLNLFKLQNNQDILSWVELCSSKLLWVEGYQEKSDPYWNTNFSLDVFCSAEKGASQFPDIITALSFFCDDRAIPGLNRPEVVAQSFLIQLIEKHRTKFNHTVCYERCLTSHRFQDATENCTSLWKLFEECLAIIQIRCLYLVIDNADILYSQCSGRAGKFHHLMEQLEKLMLLGGIVVKVLLTSRVPSLSKSVFTDDNSNRMVVSLPRGGAQRAARSSKKSDRVMRIPIEDINAGTIDVEGILNQGSIEISDSMSPDVGAPDSTDEAGSLSDDSVSNLTANKYSKWLSGSVDDSSSEEDRALETVTKQYEASDDDSETNSLFEALRTNKDSHHDDDDSSQDSVQLRTKKNETSIQSHVAEAPGSRSLHNDEDSMSEAEVDNISDSDSSTSISRFLLASATASNTEDT